MSKWKYMRNILLDKKTLVIIIISFIFIGFGYIFINAPNVDNENNHIPNVDNENNQDKFLMIWEQKFPNISPLPRTTHATAYIGNNDVMIFGGEVKNSSSSRDFWCGNDTWIYNITLNQWKQIYTISSPSPRVHVPIAYNKDDNMVLLFGGWCNEKNNSGLYNDTWIFDNTKKEWIEKKPKNSPPKLSDNGLVYTGKGKFLLQAPNGTTWTYDIVTNNWTEINNNRDIEIKRSSMSMTFSSDNIVLAFGGTDGIVYYNDTFEYNVSLNKWIKIDTVVPDGRVRPAMAYDDKRRVFVLFGGALNQSAKRFNDTWIYNMTKKEWVSTYTLDTPSVRGGYYGMAYDPILDLFVLFGGRYNGTIFLNETWILKYNN